VPPDLEGVVHKAISKDLDGRYQTAAGFADDLDNWVLGRDVVAPPYRYRFDERDIVASRPYRLTMALLALAAIGLLLAGFSGLDIAVVLVEAREKHLDAYRLAFALVVGLFGCAFVSLGASLLTGRVWAKRAVQGLGAAQGVLAAVVVFRRLLPPNSFSGFFGVAVTPLSIGLLVVLATRRSRDWFRLAERLRSEHREQVSP
jgi:hypothetical protein